MADSGATVQFCMAHLIRDIRFLAEQANKSVARWAEKLLDRLRKLFHTSHRKDRCSQEMFVLRMEAIRRGFLQQVRHPPAWSEARTLAVCFRGREAEHYFTLEPSTRRAFALRSRIMPLTSPPRVPRCVIARKDVGRHVRELGRHGGQP